MMPDSARIDLLPEAADVKQVCRCSWIAVELHSSEFGRVGPGICGACLGAGLHDEGA